MKILLYNSGGGLGDCIQLIDLITTLNNKFSNSNIWYLGAHQNHFEDKLKDISKNNISKSEVLEKYDCVVGVADANLEIYRGEIFCIMGLSGSGKSTLVRHINRLLEPTSGKITVNHGRVGLCQNCVIKPVKYLISASEEIKIAWSLRSNKTF